MNTTHGSRRLATRALAVITGTMAALVGLTVGAGAALARPLQPDDGEVTGSVTTVVRDTGSSFGWQIATITLAAVLVAGALALAISTYRHRHHLPAAATS